MPKLGEIENVDAIWPLARPSGSDTPGAWSYHDGPLRQLGSRAVRCLVGLTLLSQHLSVSMAYRTKQQLVHISRKYLR